MKYEWSLKTSFLSWKIKSLTSSLVETDNTLATAVPGCYRNIMVARPISSPDVAFLKRLQDVKPEGSNSDFVDALIVGVDMLASVEPKKGVATNMRLFLVTDAAGVVNVANLDEIIAKMNELNISLNVVGVDFQEDPTHIKSSQSGENGDEEKMQGVDGGDEDAPKVKEEKLSQPPSTPNPKKVDVTSVKDPKQQRKLRNESALRDICGRVTRSMIVPVREALDMMHYFQSRAVTSTSNFRGYLDIGTTVKIPVWTYLKTKEEGLPRMIAISKRSAESMFERAVANAHTGDAAAAGGAAEGRAEVKADGAAPSAPRDPVKREGGAIDDDANISAIPNVLEPTLEHSMGVAVEKTYTAVDNPDEIIPYEHHVRGYKYGKSWVTSVKNEAIMPFTSEPCLKVIGFTSESSVPRHFYTSNSEVVVPYSGDKCAAQGLSALCHAMTLTGMVGIVRIVKRKNSGPMLGVITPHIGEDSETLYLNRLPFNDDLRLYGFSSLVETETSPNVPKHAIPTERQLNVTEDLINSLDMSEAATSAYGEPMEALKPKYTFNPSLQYFYQVILSRALKPNLPMPSMEDSILAQVSLDEKHLKTASGAIDRFDDAFILTRTEVKEKENRKRFWSDAFSSEAADDKLESYLTDDPKKASKKKEDTTPSGLNNIQALLRGGIESVSNVTPVEDFNAMISRRDVDLVDKAIEEMQVQVLRLVNDSYKNSLYDKALECIAALRAGCIKEQESDQFNAFLQSIKAQFKGKQRNDFWVLIQQKAMTLIASSESADSGVTPEEARDFYASDAVVPDVLSVGDSGKGPEKTTGTAEELFDLLG